MFQYSQLLDIYSGPLMVKPQTGLPPLTEAVAPYLPEIRQRLRDHGAILFRGFSMPNVEAFDAFVSVLSSRHLKQLYRSTPRSDVTSRVSTATNYPPALEIPLHCENSYQRRWPLLIAFCCIEPATKGGETPIASMQAVTEDVGQDLMNCFEQRGVEYIRHYHEGADVPWTEVFQTDNREQVRRYCAESGLKCEWLNEDVLRTSQVAQGVACNPVTGGKIFFNQAHMFHVTSLGEGHAQAMISFFGDRLPRHARFGDRSEIPPSTLDQVRQAFRMNSIKFPWQVGDVMLLDNMRYAHGRCRFSGQRRVFAALMDPYP